MYECDATRDGYCDVHGVFVVVYGREREAPPTDVYTQLFGKAEVACLQRGDFVEAFSNSE